MLVEMLLQVQLQFLAMGAGKAGARGIDEYIKSKYAK